MKYLFQLGVILSIFICSASFAQTVIVKETQTWRSVPITVDPANKTYVVTESVPTDTTEYYYSYPGYRCFTAKREVVGVDGIVYTSSSGGSIYCYPE